MECVECGKVAEPDEKRWRAYIEALLLAKAATEGRLSELLENQLS